MSLGAKAFLLACIQYPFLQLPRRCFCTDLWSHDYHIQNFPLPIRQLINSLTSLSKVVIVSPTIVLFHLFYCLDKRSLVFLMDDQDVSHSLPSTSFPVPFKTVHFPKLDSVVVQSSLSTFLLFTSCHLCDSWIYVPHPPWDYINFLFFVYSFNKIAPVCKPLGHQSCPSPVQMELEIWWGEQTSKKKKWIGTDDGGCHKGCKLRTMWGAN